jgi:hypothetical protein
MAEKTYADVSDAWYRRQYASEAQKRWAEQERIEDRARQLVGEYLSEGRYVDVRPTAEQVAAIEAAHKLAGTAPDWTAIRRAANDRALRAAGLEYRDEVKRAEQAADERGD